jgi:hypothetical protein
MSRHQRDDAFTTKRILHQARELRFLEHLPVPDLAWPHDLFAVSRGAQLLSQLQLKADGMCRCGCGREHKNRVTQTVHSSRGNGWHVLYFASDTCKTRFNQARAAE